MLLDALLRRGDPVEKRAITPASMGWWARGEDYGATTDTPAGVPVNRTTALSLSAVWACVSLIADTISTLPVEAFTLDDLKVRHAAPKRPVWLDVPNPEQTRVDWMFGIVASLLLDGNAFIYTVRNAIGDVVEAWVLDPQWVQVRREFFPDGSLQLVYYVMVAKGQMSPVGPFRVAQGPDMFHIPAFVNSSGWPRGLPPLEVARMMFAGGIASQEMGTRFFGQGTNAAGVIEIPEEMTAEQAKVIKGNYSKQVSGHKNMHLPPVLTGGATWRQIQISPEQAQFLQQRMFSVEDIARFFRVPQYMIGALQKTTSWGTGIEQQGIAFVAYTLRPWLERIEEAFTRWMLMAEPGMRVGFDVAGLMRGDSAARIARAASGRQWGRLSANDVRVDEGLPPLPEDGDIYLVPLNMAAPKQVEPVKPPKTIPGIPEPSTTGAPSPANPDAPDQP